MGIKCPNCGAINNDDQISCEYCGVDLGVKGNRKYNSLVKSKELEIYYLTVLFSEGKNLKKLWSKLKK